MPTILVVDDEQDFLDSVRRGLALAGLRDVILLAHSGAALPLFAGQDCPIDVALLDVVMPGMSGDDLLAHIKAAHPAIECIMVSAMDEATTAVSCLKKGAYDYLVKPVTRDALLASVHRALERKRLLDIVNLGRMKQPPALSQPFQTLVTRSPALLRLLKEAELHAASEVPVLITGDTGTGKELLARAIHQASPRADHSFCPVNMGAINGSLFESDFFGHVKGAFTGASQDRSGYLETCHRGTLFLDEIGDLPLDFQAKLLRVLQDGEFIKLGTDKTRRADVRIIAATNADIEELMTMGHFRRDLFYRLNCARIHMPRLNERKEDVPLLVEHFLTDLGGAKHQDIEEQAMQALLAYDYQGNVRELKNFLLTACNKARGKAIALDDLPPGLRRTTTPKGLPATEESIPLKPLAEVEREHILSVYGQTSNNKTQTASLLGIGLNTLRRKLTSYGLK